MNKIVRAFAPAHLSCIFKIHKTNNPRTSGSTGLGFTLNEGVTVEVRQSETSKIYFNNKETDIDPVNKVVKELADANVSVKISTSLPLGCGFGISAAGSLATAYALNKLLNLKMSNKQLAIIAHIAEVESGTGLGDVTGQYFGGMTVRLKPSYEFSVEKIDMTNKSIYCAYFSKLSTKSVINNKKLTAQINKSAEVAMKQIKKMIAEKEIIEIGEIFKLSKQFMINSGLLTDKKTKETVERVEKKGGNASMIVLGNSVMSTIPFEGAKMYKISKTAAYLL